MPHVFHFLLFLLFVTAQVWYLCTERHRSIQVWRPLKGPVDDSPLGMIDASTVAKEDLMPYALHFPERTGYNYAVKHNPDHK